MPLKNVVLYSHQLFFAYNKDVEMSAGKEKLFVLVSDFIVMERLIVSLDFLEFPPMYTCDGENLSPRITLKG